VKKTQTDLLQGTLDLLVLKTLQSGPAAGRNQLEAETETWRLFTGALKLILKTS